VTDKTALDVLRADHTGGLRRPDWLREISAEYSAGNVREEELRAAQDRAVRELIEKQESVGLRVVSDGEVRRVNFQESFGGAVTGFDATPYTFERRAAPREQPSGPRRVESGLSGPGPAILNRRPVKERLKLSRNLILDEYRFASSVATVPVKVTLTGPDRISQRFEYESSRDVYAGMDQFLADVIDIERQMIRELVDAGCRYIQLDEPGYTAYVDPVLTEQMRASGEDPMANMERSIAADNAVIEGFPGVTFGVHICRGGGGGRGGPGWHREGHYDPIAERLFGQLNFDRFLLEYDSEAAGSFDALRYIPEGKMAVLGLVSNHGEVESEEYLKQRLEEASRFIDLDQVALCPRCGLNSVSEEVMWGKLAMVTRVAEQTWGPA
jgi:5-methyltetrahydropteroyltriglutamate--homocysteine methyltransferase